MGIFDFMSARHAQPSAPRDHRAYVVGDIHGRLDLLDQLLGEIERDRAQRPVGKTLLVCLGDLIDRGPRSAQVIERLRTYRAAGLRSVFLLGNHEEVLLRILEGDASLIPSWLRFGGAQCLESYGADRRRIASESEEQALALIRQAIPDAHRQFLAGFVDTCRFGDYLFVHAGIRPGVALDQQLQSDLRWIRDPFLLDETDHGCVVVHGHTITEQVEERANRIGIDTGAYRTGVLTALVLEGAERRYIDTRAPAETLR
jgi:serine/threonine protein phosphatase 1